MKQGPVWVKIALSLLPIFFIVLHSTDLIDVFSGKEVLPLVEGGKGISISNGESSGAWAAAGGVGTFSAVNPDAHDENGNLIPVIYKGRTRRRKEPGELPGRPMTLALSNQPWSNNNEHVH